MRLCPFALTSILVLQAQAPDPTASARSFIELVRHGKGAEAWARCGAQMAAAITAEQFNGLWKQLEAQVGPLEELGSPQIINTKGHQTLVFPARFAKSAFRLTVSLDAADKVAGFFIQPQAAAPKARAPLLTERSITVGQEPWALPGSLMRPEGKGPFPAVVLVHGSGPQDQDESIGPNHPFLDLSIALAQRGIAVLRYDKRTKVHGARFTAEHTLQEETVLDAAAAVKLLRGLPEVLPAKVFVVGHSLGGYALPRIGREAPEAAGFISLAGCSRPMEDLILEQVTLQGAPADQVKALQAQVSLVKSPDLKPNTPATQLPLGLSAPYWLNLRGYEPAKEALQIKRPWLFLQGGRDCQVLEADMAGWEKVLKVRKDVSFQRFPKLNHLFMSAPAGSKGEEYMKPGNFDSAASKAIADWVLSH